MTESECSAHRGATAASTDGDPSRQIDDPGIYAYDANGNQTSRNGVGLLYDRENRLTRYGSTTQIYSAYNGLGLRVKKTVGTTVTWYLYDGAVPVLELNNSGTVTAANTFGPNGLVSRRLGSTTSFYTFDPLGNAANVINASGTVLYNCGYDAYGQPYGNATTLTYGYGAQYGYYRDSEATTSDNLLLCTFRWYDPTTARWLTRDPIGYAGGSNLYGYVGGNPVGGVDPWGLKPGYWEQFTTKVNHGIFHAKRAWKSGTRAVCKGYEYATSTTIGRAAGGAVAAFGGVTAVLGLYNRWTDYWNAGEIAEQIHYGEAQSANEGALLCDERYMKQRQKAIRDASLRGLLFGVDFMREEYNNLPTGPTRLR